MPTSGPTTSSPRPGGATISPSAQSSAIAFDPASAADVTRWGDAVVTFAGRFNDLADDAPAAFAAFTDDAHILDPSNGDFEIGPKSVIVSSWQGWMASVDSYEARTIRTYVSRSAAVVLTDVSVVWPSGEPPMTPPLVHEARIFRFAGEPAKSVTTFELWYGLEGMAAGEGTCFKLHDCGTALEAFTQRYLAAWSGGDVSTIAGLYANDASFSDGALAIQAVGPTAIGGLAGARYGGPQPVGCTRHGAFVVTNDGDPAVSDWDNPDGGKVAGVILLTACPMGPQQRPVDSAVVLMLGTWTPDGFVLDPDGRIVREEVFHDASSLAAAGVLR